MNLIMVQNGLESLKGKSVCDHLEVVLSQLYTGRMAKFTSSASPTPDKSLLNTAQFWGPTSLQGKEL